MKKINLGAKGLPILWKRVPIGPLALGEPINRTWHRIHSGLCALFLPHPVGRMSSEKQGSAVGGEGGQEVTLTPRCSDLQGERWAAWS